MYGFISGITETENISYCPRCGEQIVTYYGDGTAVCKECGLHFGVIECEEGEYSG